jgi:hypothetical protein
MRYTLSQTEHEVTLEPAVPAVASVVLLVFANFKNWQLQFLVVGTLALIYLYLLRLIRDLDNPFDYAAGYVEGATADVSPHPVLEFRDRLEASLATDG